MNPAVSGRLLIGEQLQLVEKAGDQTENYQAVVAEWVPNSQLIWTRRTHGGLVRHVRYIEMEALSDTGCIFSNGRPVRGMAPRRCWSARSAAGR